MLERRSQPLLPRREYFKRLIRSAVVGFSLICFSLLIGMMGYHLLEGLPWLDAFVNASMLLGGRARSIHCTLSPGSCLPESTRCTVDSPCSQLQGSFLRR